jgi:hypothetical protein
MLRGNGEQNLQILFLTPAGEIFHAISGYVSPADFLEELAFARKIHATLNVPSIDRRALVQTIHRAALAAAKKRTFSGPLGDWERRRVLEDLEFSIRHPLLPAAEFRIPMLTGSGGGFFGSTSDASRAPKIGRDEPGVTPGTLRELLRRLREQGKLPDGLGEIEDLVPDGDLTDV